MRHVGDGVTASVVAVRSLRHLLPRAGMQQEPRPRALEHKDTPPRFWLRIATEGQVVRDRMPRRFLCPLSLAWLFGLGGAVGTAVPTPLSSFPIWIALARTLFQIEI